MTIHLCKMCCLNVQTMLDGIACKKLQYISSYISSFMKEQFYHEKDALKHKQTSSILFLGKL